MNGCFSSSFADGLLCGSFCKQSSTNCLKSGLKLPSNCGAGFLGIKNSTFIGWISEYGGSPLASSSAVMPRLHISALWSYPLCLMTSGAIQNGVPTKVFFFVIVCESCPETPKSASLTCPFAPSRIFAALISRWSLLSLCRYSNPSSNSRRTIQMYSSGISPGLMRSAQLPPLQNSMMIHRSLPFK